MENLWNSEATSEGKDSGRPLHGRLYLVPNNEDFRQDSQYPGSSRYDVWNTSDDTNKEVKILADCSQQTLSKHCSHYSQEEQQHNAKVNRSQSFSEHGMKMDYLMAPDPRRFSFASNESGMSSASSMSDIWSHEPTEHKKSFSQMFKTEEFLQMDSIWKESEYHFSGDKCHSIKENSVYDSDYFYQPTKSARNSTDLFRRSSGFSSESERSSRRTSSNLDRRYSRMSIDSNRRDSELSSFSDRRSSGFVSDFDRRDSNSSNSSAGHFSVYTEQHPSGFTTGSAKPGMEHVPRWLKSLRLHKYTDLLMGMSFTEMMELSEEKLERLSVTKGARRKIIGSIQKLVERPQILATIDSELELEDCDVKKVLLELESVIKSPIKIDEEGTLRRRHDSGRDSGAEVSEDEEREVGGEVTCDGRKLVKMIMNTLRRTCSLILLSQHADTKNVALLSSLLDLCLSCDCYLPHQKQLLLSWKHKLYSIWGPLPSPNQNTSHKDKTFHMKSPSMGHPSMQSAYGDYNTIPTTWAGWDHHLNQDKERLTVPPLSESFNQRKLHPFLMQRKSAPNIESSVLFPSPRLYKKRYSFQDGAVNLRASLQPRYSLPSIEPQLQTPVLHSNQEYPLVTSQESDWGARLNNASMTFADLWSEKEKSLEADDANACDEAGIKEESPTAIIVTDTESSSDTELNSRLECLCLAVTEQALD